MISKIQRKEIWKRVEGLLTEEVEGDLIERICEIIFGKERDQIQKIETIVAESLKEIYGQKMPVEIGAFLFTRLDALEDKLAEETDEEIVEKAKKIDTRNQMFEKYYSIINNDFTMYYMNIERIIEESSLFIREDLNYILFQLIYCKTGEIYEIDTETLFMWKDKYEFLTIPPKEESKDQKRNIEKCLCKVKEILNTNTRFPIQFDAFFDCKKECLCIKDINIAYQIALLFYNDFRNRFLPKRKCKFKFESVSMIRDNIEYFMFKNEEYINTKYDSELFMYLMERLMGINLCLEYGKYYDVILSYEECENSVERRQVIEYLKNIFKHFCEMPNIITRGRIVYEYMQPVVVSNQMIRKQLIIIEKQVRKLKEMYCEIVNKMEEIIKNIGGSLELIEAYQDNLGEQIKKIEGLEHVENMLLLKEINCSEDMLISEEPKIIYCKQDTYKELQKEYVESIKF